MNDTVNPSGWFDLDENGLYLNSQFFVRFLSYYRWSVYANRNIENDALQDNLSSQKDTVVMTMTENSGRIIMAISKYPSFIGTLHYIFSCRGYSIDIRPIYSTRSFAIQKWLIKAQYRLEKISG